MANLLSSTQPAVLTSLVLGELRSQQPYLPLQAQQADSIIENMKCFLCDHDFAENEEPWLIFEKREQADGHLESPLSVILSSALGRELEEDTAHSKILCDTCNATILDYENIEQRFYEMRFSILSEYNKMAKRNNLPTIAIEINGELQNIEDVAIDDAIIANNTITEVFVPKMESGELSTETLSSYVIEHLTDVESCIEKPLNAVSIVNQSGAPQTVIPTEQNFSIETSTTRDKTVKMEPMEFIENDITENIIDVEDVEGVDGDIYYDIIEQSSNISREDEEGITSASNENLQDNICNDSADMIYANVINETCIGEEVITTAASTQKRQATRVPRQLKDTHTHMYQQQEGGSYTCLLCIFEPQYDPQAFAEHMRTKHGYRFYTCDLCGNGFARRQDLNDHMDEHHGEQGSFECETCHRIFANYRLFRIHKRMHYTSMKQFECTECHRKYGSKNLLDEHMNMHTGKRPYKCSQCPKDFASKYTLNSHAKIHTERQRPFQCDMCDKAFLSQQNLTHHRKLHSGVKSFVCEICSKAFGTQHNLLVHKIVHTGNKPFLCRTCGKAFARRAEIKDHERIHTGERPFKCDICHMAFAQRSNLTSHRKSTHFNEKLHKCDQCERSFKRRRLLDYHIQSTHTGERPHKCDVCGASFVYPEHHKKHMLIHLGIKPFACEVCGKQFNSRDNRNAHRFIHSDKKPYECLECGAGFMRKPLLLAHMKQTKHSNDTIIVNQPHISLSDGTLSLTNVVKDSDDDDNDDGIVEEIDSTSNSQDEITVVDENADEIVVESYENMMKRAENILTAVENNDDDDDDDENDSNDDITRVSGQLIKDEIGDVKYLQFEELDGDGHQTLTWVDIGDKNS